MTRLHTLRARLASLRQARSAARGAGAWSALVIALLWALAGVCLLDVVFELAPPQRIVVFLLAAAGVAWAYVKYTRPLLGVQETDIDMALLVERQQQIDSDLVAALQFEGAQAAAWGSPQLAAEVIQYVAHASPTIDVFEGFNRQQMLRRAGLLAVTLAALVAAAVAFPQHAEVFFSRLLLGGAHYPTRTQIERVLVAQRETLDQSLHGTQPRDASLPQGRPVEFLVQCGGELPEAGAAYLSALGGQQARTTLQLKKLSPEERLARLTTAQQMLRDAQARPEVDIAGPWRDEVAALLRCDAPAAADKLPAPQAGREGLSGAIAELETALSHWPAPTKRTALYAAQLGRLVDGVRYKLALGDAWTDPARVQMIPLPIVEPRLTVLPPKYAAAQQEQPDAAGRQFSVLEGTLVQVAIECVNGKRLKSAWVTAKTKAGAARYELQSADGTGRAWRLAEADTPFASVREEVRYEIQVTDADGLHLETPLAGVIRIRPDRAPQGSAEVVHRVVLPEAEPLVQYRVSDDFGVSRLVFHLEVERQADERAAERARADDDTTPGQARPKETRDVEVLPAGQMLAAASLPLSAKFPLSLSPLKLAKGDHVKVVLEVVDWRGDQPGVSAFSDPLTLEISDVSGVLAAISEADEQTEQRVTEIIKRELGIGESP